MSKHRKTDADMILIIRLLKQGRAPMVIKAAIDAEGGNVRRAAYGLGLMGGLVI